MGCGSLITGAGWGPGAVQGTWKGTLIDAMKIVQVGKLAYLASMCMQVFCAFLWMYAYDIVCFCRSFVTQQGFTNDWQKNWRLTLTMWWVRGLLLSRWFMRISWRQYWCRVGGGSCTRRGIHERGQWKIVKAGKVQLTNACACSWNH